jgi:hypothetical protein
LSGRNWTQVLILTFVYFLQEETEGTEGTDKTAACQFTPSKIRFIFISVSSVCSCLILFPHSSIPWRSGSQIQKQRQGVPQAAKLKLFCLVFEQFFNQLAAAGQQINSDGDFDDG